MANLLESPLVGTPAAHSYVAFDSDPERVLASQRAGFKVLYGDATRSAVLRAAGVKDPRAVVVCYAEKSQALTAVHCIRAEYPQVPIYVTAADLR